MFGHWKHLIWDWFWRDQCFVSLESGLSTTIQQQKQNTGMIVYFQTETSHHHSLLVWWLWQREFSRWNTIPGSQEAKGAQASKRRADKKQGHGTWSWSCDLVVDHLIIWCHFPYCIIQVLLVQVWCYHHCCIEECLHFLLKLLFYCDSDSSDDNETTTATAKIDDIISLIHESSLGRFFRGAEHLGGIQRNLETFSTQLPKLQQGVPPTPIGLLLLCHLVGWRWVARNECDDHSCSREPNRCA